MRENTLKQRLYAGKAAFGVMCTFPSPPLVETGGPDLGVEVDSASRMSTELITVTRRWSDIAACRLRDLSPSRWATPASRPTRRCSR